ncbi:tRNA (adenosine(37)-N6)-threonylcarbamoyltransferase complex ATPase subunit type 1 TsaE [Afifella marina]|uniref:tRNA threonylcarbamoyladenosine biosynthesis protein TsaE n=1 Tax=Afifella marina DSM 2698 TaxID=1120955 RepID=A0A1G5NF60_AFIMA|nr:tRNA (adenosine(37)-N6)-threonylcarbamoyltransferase complex ATPase subunit type 1 TsaE [Afifella marina]MBK1623318.1 tRNA (adenosine(37)-N6)-threonylcarbamoyltransferase complex ATPase subunit type 1 TsaE [Afifella marina DSM 2698]MBK1626312.1 tRNA (adenosine(37)-N6)-threonylcarbamoyltransferase complex ATPase subunit type 1 TsaE [Afifella marina]MBK5917190.1 tRNA (adenosine(37)-N6)-threonylcarbamoyltransferase complex ATPase subunit type 1 TsaE [Afifella marina]RAI22163.1 tRNA (adenosine(3
MTGGDASELTGAAAGPDFRLHLQDEAATDRLAEDFAAAARPGDRILLSGDLGSGKTSFARAFIRSLAGDPSFEVPSPTFPLRIDYPFARFPVVHADLYRLGAPDEAEEIGLFDLADDTVLLAEWPELGDLAWPDAATLSFALATEGRDVVIAAGGDWGERLTRSFAIRRFLDRSGRAGATRNPILGDASGRSYERIVNGAEAILMNAPARPEGPAVWQGKSYDAVAHRARDLSAFLKVGSLLAERGVRVPEVLAQDVSDGLLLVEDFGSEAIITAERRPLMERYEASVDLLLRLHLCENSADASPSRSAGAPDLPPYDTDALLIETALFAEHFAGREAGPEMSEAARDEFLALWRTLFESLAGREQVIVLRDYHSPNIIWRKEADGTDRVGVIDFQDALLGDPAYDVASLAQDVRVDIDEAEEELLVARYIRGRRAADPAFDEAPFRDAYAILGAQRATKVLGAFARLAHEGKPAYRSHIPRIRARLRRSLDRPVLSELRRCYDPYL